MTVLESRFTFLILLYAIMHGHWTFQLAVIGKTVYK